MSVWQPLEILVFLIFEKVVKISTSSSHLFVFWFKDLGMGVVLFEIVPLLLIPLGLEVALFWIWLLLCKCLRPFLTEFALYVLEVILFDTLLWSLFLGRGFLNTNPEDFTWSSLWPDADEQLASGARRVSEDRWATLWSLLSTLGKYSVIRVIFSLGTGLYKWWWIRSRRKRCSELI